MRQARCLQTSPGSHPRQVALGIEREAVEHAAVGGDGAPRGRPRRAGSRPCAAARRRSTRASSTVSPGPSSATSSSCAAIACSTRRELAEDPRVHAHAPRDPRERERARDILEAGDRLAQAGERLLRASEVPDRHRVLDAGAQHERRSAARRARPPAARESPGRSRARRRCPRSGRGRPPRRRARAPPRRRPAGRTCLPGARPSPGSRRSPRRAGRGRQTGCALDERARDRDARAAVRHGLVTDEHRVVQHEGLVEPSAVAQHRGLHRERRHDLIGQLALLGVAEALDDELVGRDLVLRAPRRAYVDPMFTSVRATRSRSSSSGASRSRSTIRRRIASSSSKRPRDARERAPRARARRQPPRATRDRPACWSSRKMAWYAASARSRSPDCPDLRCGLEPFIERPHRGAR